jgi:hypothetical protein
VVLVPQSERGHGWQSIGKSSKFLGSPAREGTRPGEDPLNLLWTYITMHYKLCYSTLSTLQFMIYRM